MKKKPKSPACQIHSEREREAKRRIKRNEKGKRKNKTEWWK